MKIIFGKQFADASLELKEALGFIDADLRLVNLKSDLRRATYDLIAVIGEETYKEIISLYISGKPTGEDEWDEDLVDELVHLTQYHVGVTAYSYYAPSSDIVHGNNGRKMDNGEHQKTPFEHLLVRDDEALQRRAYRGLDDLLNFLDKHSTVWKQSEAYKLSHKLFIRTVKEFDQFFNMNSRLLLIKLAPGIAQCEKREILPRIGIEAFNFLKSKRNGTSEIAMTEKDNTLLYLIQDACVNASLAWGLPRMRATLFPEGVLKQVRSERSTISGRSVTMGNEIEQMAQHFKDDALATLQEIESLVAVPLPATEISEVEDTTPDYGFDGDDIFVNT